MLCFISDEKNIKLSTYQREAPLRCSCRHAAGVGLFVFVFVVCTGARRTELKIAAAYEGVVSNVTADAKIRKPAGIYSSQFIIGAGRLLQM